MLQRSIGWLVFPLVCSALGADDAGLAGRGRAVVRVYDYAAIPKTTLAGAETVAGDLFRRAGIDTVWVYCALGPELFCEPVDAAESTVINLRILPAPMSRPLQAGLARDALGVARISEGEDTPIAPGNHATVFFQRIADLIGSVPDRTATVLGVVMAHEAAHLLLGSNRHSTEGVMRRRLTWREFQLAAQARLRFTQEQALRMRKRLTPGLQPGYALR